MAELSHSAWVVASLAGACLTVAACSSNHASDAGPKPGLSRDAATTVPGTYDAGSDAANPARDDPSQVFVAFAKDFVGFRDWQHYEVTIEDDAGPQHPEEVLVEYINKLPPSGASEFLPHTIIVKEPKSPPSLSFFAMVKRGGNFNPDGARNWEWFELQNIDNGGILIVWRGVGPPNDDEYGGDPNGGGCNDCHTPEHNDSVLAKALDLRNF